MCVYKKLHTLIGLCLESQKAFYDKNGNPFEIPIVAPTGIEPVFHA